ncbi:MAG: hypothetical protein JSU06_14010 [Actinobacteria bacterium]|nr:hypothetical protein [Actinomycetota bacterium]
MRASVRPKVHDAYWLFAARRNEILMSRVRGEAGPWTDDPILRRFKFCNTFRAADRVSQFLIREVIYGERWRALPAEDVFLRIVLFRLFSKERTWEALEEATGGVRLSTLDVAGLGDVLESMRCDGPIYTAAFILAAPNGFGYKAKHRNHLALVHDMFRRGGLGLSLSRARSLGDVYDALVSYPMIGPFLGYQIAVDLNYSEHLAFDEDEFTVPGPGAQRGIEKVFSDRAGESPEDLIARMVDRQEDEFDRLGLDFGGLFGRRLHAIDCQGLFCETDKYARQAFPELKSNRVRIKQEFTPDPRPLELTFPPKWGLDVSVTAERQEPPLVACP